MRHARQAEHRTRHTRQAAQHAPNADGRLNAHRPRTRSPSAGISRKLAAFHLGKSRPPALLITAPSHPGRARQVVPHVGWDVGMSGAPGTSGV
ncbi:hypothetical protein GCM10029964_023890 [Kibdelosporangium lantanae]